MLQVEFEIYSPPEGPTDVVIFYSAISKKLFSEGVHTLGTGMKLRRQSPHLPEGNSLLLMDIYMFVLVVLK